MKNMKITTAVLAIAIAVGGAFMTHAEEPATLQDNQIAMLDASEDAVAQLGYYRTVPSDPSTCQTFSNVNCSPAEEGPLCIMNVQGQAKQLYDNDCSTPLRYEPIK